MDFCRAFEKIWKVLAVTCLALCHAFPAFATERHQAFPPLFNDRTIFLEAIQKASDQSLSPRRVSGITVPHHLLAADLIASGLKLVEPLGVEKIVILFPDHFKLTRLAFATTLRPFDTVFGSVNPNRADIQTLLRLRHLVEESSLFGVDHGIGAVLPFVRYYFPKAKVIPIAVSLGSTQSDWDRLASTLVRIIGRNTLVVQSTDFSHHRPLPEAVQRDQEVLNVLSAGDLKSAARLRQPTHTDSRGSQYLQLRIQRDVFKAQPIAIFNKSSQAYADQHPWSTTTYIVQVYQPSQTSKVANAIPGSEVYCFAGDTFLGRGLLRVPPSEKNAILKEAKGILNGCRLILNFTGVLVPELPANLDPGLLAMPAPATLEWLKQLNVVAVNLANNHAMDLGTAAYQSMLEQFSAVGIQVLQQGTVLDFGSFRLTALTDVDNRTRAQSHFIKDSDIQALVSSAAKPPFFAMMSWGGEFDTKPGARQTELADALDQAAVSLVVGVRPHLSSAHVDITGGGRGLRVFSLGNFLFDQDASIASGSLLEVRIFAQGTYFARLLPHPTFFGARRRKPAQ